MTKYILSLESGGIRSIIQIYFLYHLENDLKKITGKSIYDTFDMYAGTSGGALVLGALVYSNFRNIEDILRNYFSETIMKNIFKKSIKSTLFGPLFMPKYNATQKHKILHKDIGSKFITDTDKNVMITAYSITEEVPRFFKSYESKNETKNTLVVDIIDASSAAPGLFPTAPFEYNSKIEYGTDGAIFASDPADCVYADALKVYGPNEDIRILSIGTGFKQYPKFGRESRKWGLYQWVVKGHIIDKLIDIDENIVYYRMQQFTKVLGHKYIKIQGNVDIPLDSISSMKQLENIALEWYNNQKNNLFNTLFPEHTSILM